MRSRGWDLYTAFSTSFCLLVEEDFQYVLELGAKNVEVCGQDSSVQTAESWWLKLSNETPNLYQLKSPHEASWSEEGCWERLWCSEKKRFVWLSVNCNSERMCTKKWNCRIPAVKIPIPQSSSWCPPAYQEACRLWVQEWWNTNLFEWAKQLQFKI